MAISPSQVLQSQPRLASFSGFGRMTGPGVNNGRPNAAKVEATCYRNRCKRRIAAIRAQRENHVVSEDPER